ncbi:fat-like cadherin-related tumor suppressor homolog [Dendronephthya gigantea]|uniref:fat-like cadherin-related tumor suppressor homolog n=1 Tax=Dendronephthya gigantea TaxID=151771 RepID=UPI00106BC784|nr:fat-like cadherin-related tumor suppressor homolog [Dendronephthya gigantea]
MIYQDGWCLTICCFLLLIGEVAPSGPNTLSENERFPNKDETEVCGTIRDVIQRDSGRFRRILIRNTNDDVDYINDDARRMSSRAKSKLDVLASLVKQEWPPPESVRVRVTKAWTDQFVASDPTSLHYEGRSVQVEMSDRSSSKVGRLAGLAIDAGFDWVERTSVNYIRASVIPDVCQTSVDLVFVLDGSGSVGENNFKKVKEFVKRVIDFFNIGVDGTHVAVVTYETDTNIEFNLVKYYTKTDLRKAVDDIKYRGYLTYTGEALNDVREKVFTASAGMRTDVGIPKVLVLLTDGYSNGISVLQPSDQLRQLGVSIFSIGVGPSVSQSELKEIASDPDEEYVFTLSSFNQLASFVDRVSSVSCSEGALIDSCKSAETSVESGSFKYFRTTFKIVTKDEVSVEVRDLQGISHLYVSASSKNPGPLDPASIKNEENTSPKAVSVQLDATKTVYVAVQGQEANNKFRLSFLDNLFTSNTFQVNVKEGLDAHEILTLSMVVHPYSLTYSISDGDKLAFSIKGSSPEISTKIRLDYETTQQYRLVIVADDVNDVCHKSRALVDINVIDVNDNAPTFARSQYTASIDENAQSGALC